MMNLKQELGVFAMVVLAAGGTALASPVTVAQADDQAPQQQAPTGQAPAGQTQNDSDDQPVQCPVPGQQGQTAQAGQYQYQGGQYQQGQAQPPPPPNYGPAPAPAEEEYGAGAWMHDIGLGISVGGGVDDFVGDTMRGATGVGGDWTARLTLGTRSFIGAELSYIGSAQSISRLGLSSNSELIGNGAQAVVRINGTVDYPVQPFIYGGAAWRHYSLNNSGANFSDVSNSNDTFEVPLGVGLGTYLSGLMLDVRGEYRFAWGDHTLVPTSSGGDSLLDRWAVTGTIGYAF